MQHNYRDQYLVTTENDHNKLLIHKHGSINFEEPFLILKATQILIGRSQFCKMTELLGAKDDPDFDGFTILVEVAKNEFYFLSGECIHKFVTGNKIIDLISNVVIFGCICYSRWGGENLIPQWPFWIY